MIRCQHIGFCHNVAAVGWQKVFRDIEPAIVTHHWITDCQAAQQVVVKMDALPLGQRQQGSLRSSHPKRAVGAQAASPYVREGLVLRSSVRTSAMPFNRDADPMYPAEHKDSLGRQCRGHAGST